MRHFLIPLMLAPACVGTACTGNIGDRRADPADPGGTGGSGEPITCPTNAPDPGEAPLRLLTQEQYLNTIHDLFGPVNLDAVYPRTESASTFGFAQGDVDQVALENYQRAAGLIGAAVAADKATLGRLAPCPGASSDQRGCARSFVQTFGARLYRSPVDATDADRHLTLYDVGMPNGGYVHGIEMLLRGMLQSPRFLYRVELGTTEAVGAHAVKLSGYEVAARLSYGFWNTTPDDALYAAAARGALSTAAGAVAELQRMLQERGNTPVNHFLESWIHMGDLYGVAKDTTRFPDWTPALRTSMVAQARTFFDDVVNQQGASLAALLTSPTVFVDRNLAPFYGVDPASIPSGVFQKMQRTGTDSGMLTLPAFLATQAKAGESSPIYRGKFVREQLFCQQLPAPPPNVPPAPQITPGTSTRERLAEHETNPVCAGCHSKMDPIGFGFETYDGIGRYRTTDGGKTIDTTGEVTDTRDIDGPFDGVGQLTAKLAKSIEVEECLPTQWFRYAMGRFEQDADGCSVRSVVKTFRASGGDLQTLPRAIVQSDAFLYRRPIVPEVRP